MVGSHGGLRFWYPWHTFEGCFSDWRRLHDQTHGLMVLFLDNPLILLEVLMLVAAVVVNDR